VKRFSGGAGSPSFDTLISAMMIAHCTPSSLSQGQYKDKHVVELFTENTQKQAKKVTIKSGKRMR
jgi:hypothetical protein